MPSTTRMRAEDRREQLLDVTASLVDEQGLHPVTIEAVARRAGVTRPVVYEHFGGLEGLLEAVVDRVEARALAQLPALLPAGEGPDALLGALAGYLEAVRADPVTWRLVLMPPEGAPAALRERIARGRTRVVGRLAALLAAGTTLGEPSPDPELTAHMLSSLSDDAARLVLLDPERFPVERILTHARWLLTRLA